MSKNKKQILILILTISLIFNLHYTFKEWNAPDYKIGLLTRDIEIRLDFIDTGDNGRILLPQGLIVENRSPEGIPRIGQFQPERFSITVTSDNPNLVNYSSKSAKTKGTAIYPAKELSLSYLSGNDSDEPNSSSAPND